MTDARISYVDRLERDRDTYTYRKTDIDILVLSITIDRPDASVDDTNSFYNAINYGDI